MKKLSKINESIWGDINRRSQGQQAKKEDGKKVKTCLGTTITIKDASCDYDYWINKIIESDPNISYGMAIDLSKYMNLTPDEMVNVSKWEAPYDYLIYDGLHGTSLIADFYAYDYISEREDDLAECVSEEDYISLCRGIALKLKEVGQYLSHVPQRNAYIIGSRSGNCKYSGDYVLELINEADTSYYFSNNEDVDIEDFMNDIYNEFPELKDTDLISWTFYDGNNIGIPVNVNNLINFIKYKNFTKDWFAVSEVDESIWGDINRRSQGNQVKKEDNIHSNVNDMIPVDLGLSVLWADRDLEIDGEVDFLIDDVKDYEPNGWRRPTREEADELLKCKWSSSRNNMTLSTINKNGYQVIFHNNGNELVFNCRFGKYSEFFERENTEQEGYWSLFSFKKDGPFLPHSVYSMVKLDEPARVRFVRDKK